MRLEDLLQQPEGDTLDFKRDLSSLTGVVKAVCAFANTNGGVLVIGVDDDRRVVGLADPQGDEERLMNVLADRLEPRPTVQVRHASHDGKEVLLVSLAFQDGPVHLKSKPLEAGTYGRYGSVSRVVDEGRLAELRRHRESRCWDELPCPGATRADFDDGLAERTFTGRGADYSESVLRTCKLLADRAGELVPTNAGIVLFGRDRAKHHLDDARWRCIRYPGVDKSTRAISPVDFEDKTVLEALGDVVDYVREGAGTFRDIEGLDRHDRPAVSDAVLREVLVNAIAHANYEVKGSRLNAAVYTDRVEVQSPGAWPPAYGFENLRDGVSQVRNRAIARTLRTLRYMEEHGTAWARVQEAAAEGYPEPAWEANGPVLRVIVPKHPVFATSQKSAAKTAKRSDGRSANAAARQALLLSALRDRAPDDVAMKDLGALVGDVHLATLYRDVDALERRGLVSKPARGRVAAVTRAE